MSDQVHHYPWGMLRVVEGVIAVGGVVLAIPASKENLDALQTICDRVYDAGRRDELRHVRETLGIRE